MNILAENIDNIFYGYRKLIDNVKRTPGEYSEIQKNTYVVINKLSTKIKSSQQRGASKIFIKSNKQYLSQDVLPVDTVAEGMYTFTKIPSGPLNDNKFIKEMCSAHR